MSREEIIAAIRAQQEVLASEGVAHLALFGSRARNEAGPDSDLDILIDVLPGRQFSLLNVSGVALVIEDALGIPSQIVLRRSMPPDFAARIAGDVVEVF